MMKLVLLLALAINFAAAGDLWAAVQKTPELSTLKKFIVQRNLVSRLNEGGSFTLFAPSNSAFSAQPQQNINFMNNAANEEETKKILLFHIMRGAHKMNELMDAQTGTSYNDMTLNFYDDGANGQVENAAVTRKDIKADNGILHVIDRMMVPPGAQLPVTDFRRRRLAGLGEAAVDADGEQNIDEAGEAEGDWIDEEN